MATIPQYDQRTRVSGVSGVDLPDRFGGEALARALGDAAQLSREMRLQAQAREEEAAHVAANDELMSARSEWLTQLQNRQLSAAAGAPDFTPTILSDFDEDVKQRLERAKTPTAKTYLQQQLAQVRLGLQQDAMSFEAGQRVDLKTSQLGSALDQARTAVEFRPLDFDTIAAEQAGAVLRSGLPAEQQQVLIERTQDALSSAAVAGMIRKNPYAALLELNNEKSENLAVRALAFDDRMRLRAAAEAEIRGREAEGRETLSRLRADLAARVEDAQAAYLNGIDVESPPTRADFLRAYPADQAKDADRDYNAFAAIQRIGADLKVAARLPPEEQAELLEARKPTQVEGAADQIKAYDVLAAHVATLNRQLEADPAAYVAAHDPATRSAALNMAQETTPETVDAYATASLAAQARHGVTVPRLLTEGQANAMGERLKLGANGEQVVDAINTERAMWGRHWSRAIAEASPKLNPAVQVMALEVPVTGNAAGPMLSMDPVPAARLATIAALKDEDIAKILPTDVRRSDIEVEVSDALAEFGQTLIGAAGAEEQLVRLGGATEKLAASYVAAGASPDEAAARAASEVILSRYAIGEYAGSLLRFPIGIDSELALAGLRTQDDAFLEGLETDYDEVAWRTLPDDTGIVLEDRATGRPVANSEGKPYTLSFARLMQLGVNRREDIRRATEDLKAVGP